MKITEGVKRRAAALGLGPTDLASWALHSLISEYDDGNPKSRSEMVYFHRRRKLWERRERGLDPMWNVIGFSRDGRPNKQEAEAIRLEQERLDNLPEGGKR